MYLEMAFIFNNADIAKSVLEYFAEKHDLIIEYRSSTGSHLMNIKKRSIVATSNMAEADIVLVVDANNAQLTAIPVSAISIIRVLN